MSVWSKWVALESEPKEIIEIKVPQRKPLAPEQLERIKCSLSQILLEKEKGGREGHYILNAIASCKA